MCTRRADGGVVGGVAIEAGGGISGPQAGVLSAPYRTPWGDGSVTVRQGRLIGVDLPGQAAAAVLRGAPAVRIGAAKNGADREALDRWVGELEAYFLGRRLAWTAEEIPLDGLGVGAFAGAVYAALLSVPPAVTVSYGALAEMAGYPRAARAVGTAMATNPIPVVIPCHRVIRSDGSLGNYGNDPAWKQRLLVHELEYAGEMGGER
jgi:methylated-DNA-[protein]-cysteine S-methyltransferase